VNRGILRDATIDLSGNGIVTIVGKNDVGKTFLVKSLVSTLKPEEYVQSEERHYLEWDIKSEYSQQRTTRNPFLDSEVCSFGIEVGSTGNPTEFAVFDSRPEDQNSPHLKEHPTGRFWWPLTPDFQSNNGMLKIQPNESTTSTPMISKRFYDAIKGQWKMPEIFYFAHPRLWQDNSMVREDSRLSPDAQNLTNVFHSLQGSMPRITRSIIESLQDIFPTIGSLGVRLADTQANLVLTDSNDLQLRLNQVGGGVGQAAAATTAIASVPRDCVVIIEEPESGLHPQAQRNLTATLRHLLADRKLILTTHSPYVLEALDEGDRIHLVTRTSISSEVLDVSGSLRDALDIIGVGAFGLLQARYALIVEGASDKLILSRLLLIDLIRHDIAIVQAEGAKNLANFEEALRSLPELDDESILVLADRDERDSNENTRSRWLQLKRREIENYFLDSPESICFAMSKKIRVEHLTAVEIESQLRVMADQLQNEVVWLRTRHLIHKVIDRKSFNISRPKDIGEMNVANMVAILHKLSVSIPDQEQVEATWKQCQEDTVSRWDNEWKILVPGERLLTMLYKSHGTGYNKVKDGKLIAERIATSALPIMFQDLRKDILAGFNISE
jgi:ABC-type branched-subunit amino acid transport system ATPase component